jgi:hypothetical protein
MLSTLIQLNNKMSLRDKARLNICIARDLADCFGGRKADYLIRLNRRLKVKIIIDSISVTDCMVIST